MKLPRPVKRILFVCYGNLCRSVLAEALMRKLLDTRGLDHIEVGSAGIGAFPDYPAPQQIVEVAQDRDLGVNGHRSRPLDGVLLDWADLVLVMESYMREEISRMWPGKDMDKVLLLGSCAPEFALIRGIQDPFGGSLEDFDRCYGEIEASVKGLFERLVSEKALTEKTF